MLKSQETMAVYKKYKVNPVAGCLIAFIQLPLFFGFLQAINRVPAIFEDSLFKMKLGMTPWIGISKGNYIYIVLLVLIVVKKFQFIRFMLYNINKEKFVFRRSCDVTDHSILYLLYLRQYQFLYTRFPALRICARHFGIRYYLCRFLELQGSDRDNFRTFFYVRKFA